MDYNVEKSARNTLDSSIHRYNLGGGIICNFPLVSILRMLTTEPVYESTLLIASNRNLLQSKKKLGIFDLS